MRAMEMNRSRSSGCVSVHYARSVALRLLEEDDDDDDAEEESCYLRVKKREKEREADSFEHFCAA